MARERIHADDNERAKAYRQRLADRKRQTEAGWGDNQLGPALRSLHESLTAAGSPYAGGTPLETLAKLVEATRRQETGRAEDAGGL